MDKTYNHSLTEQKWYRFWEENGYFKPEINPKGKPYCILLPPPNANAPLHMGHAMYVIEDILIRYHRLLGDSTLYLPGTDHAGIETQYVFEKELKKKGKSRFDFDRETLYQMINDYVEKNRGIAKSQMKQLGFSLDWSRECYTLDPKVLKIVLATFKKLYKDGLIYRAERIVNYCTNCGTAFSDLEVIYEERKDPLYFMKYGPFVLATVRPETKFGDTAVAVNPKDKRYQKFINQEFIYQSLIGPRKMKVVADSAVDPDFGTGVVKVTPAHDPNDFDIARRHNLKILKVIDLDGRLNKNAGRFAGLSVFEARKKVVSELKQKGDLVRVEENYTHRVGICYRCKKTIEPMVIPQWFIKIEKLAKPAIEAVKKGKVKIFPPRFKKLYLDWMENVRDWNISRQIVWGPRIPAWYCLDCNPEIKINFLNKDKKLVSDNYKKIKNKYSFAEIKSGLQTLNAPVEASFLIEEPSICPKCGGNHLLQETDTFDTWFSSGQWPLTTLGYPASPDFKKFYPTSLLDTMWDILFFWVARMIMFGLYLAGKIPFRVAHMHSRVVDIERKKMSKSKGNVIDPIEMVKKYGADALRMALVFGTAPASDIVVTEDKIKAMRNFCNKIWNATRFIITNPELKIQSPKIKTPTQNSKLNKDDQWILEELNKTVRTVTRQIETYRFGQASEILYNFFWHKFCDVYIEKAKKRKTEAQPVLIQVLATSLTLLHPFMPFITEELWNKLPRKDKKPLIISPWPKSA